jgi:2-oxo-4-hydroxy-4-carboxy-5-ureidoimidazoline decarboxylase
VPLSIAELDAMPEGAAAALLAECCGSSRWVRAMVARRPFGRRERVRSAAEEIWRSLDPADWKEAFAHHPRIGEERSAAPQGPQGRAWSRAEQAGMRQAGDQVRAALASANREYERRFGYGYLVCATGRTADELLAMARERLGNEPGRELAIAAEEQRKITALRLERLLREPSQGEDDQ